MAQPLTPAAPVAAPVVAAAAPAPSATALDMSVETLRAIAIVLMVAGHVIGGTGVRGLQVAERSGLRYFYYCFEYLRMPLFTVISGYLYARRPATRAGYPQLLRAKARRLLWPLVTVSTVQYLVQCAVPSVNKHVTLAGLPQIYLWPQGQFWFLYAVFGIFVVVGLCDALDRLDTPGRWLLALALSLAVFVGVKIDVELFSVDDLARLLPFFLLGYGLRRYDAPLRAAPLRAALVSVFLASFVAQQLIFFRDVPLGWHQNRLLAMLVGVPGLILIMQHRPTWTSIAWLGPYAYGIYLFHVFGLAAARIGLRALGVHTVGALFAVSLVAGVAGGVLIERMMQRWALTRRYVLGLSA